MILSHNKRFIFVHIPKVAGKSIKASLEPYNSRPYRLNTYYKAIPNFLPFNPYMFSGCFHAHVPASSIQTSLPEKVFKEYFKFAFVRNPWDRAVSIYFYILKTPKHKFHNIVSKMESFEEYLEWLQNGWTDEKVKTQKHFIVDNSGSNALDFIGYFENIQQDFYTVCQQLTIPEQPLPFKNRSNHRDYRSYYSSKSKHIVEKIFKEDIDFFNYQF